VPHASQNITKALTAQCTHNLKPVWRVTATYRMTNKEVCARDVISLFADSETVAVIYFKHRAAFV
jgi:hypothetical protein